MATEKGLNALIRLAERRLDECRRQVVELEQQRAEQEAALRRLDEEVARETQLADADLDLRAALPAYLGAMQERRRGIEGEIVALDHAIAERRDEIHEAFQELKRFEIARDQRAAEAAYEAGRAEQDQLDEMGLVIHRRAPDS